MNNGSEDKIDELNSVFESFGKMPNGIVIISENNEIKYANKHITEIYGHYNGKKCHDYFHNQSETCSHCFSPKVFKGETIRFEFEQQKTNKIYDLTVTPFTLPDGSLNKLEIFHDITEHKKLNKALKDNEELLRAMFDQNNVGVVIGDNNGIFLKANDKFCNLLGYTFEELLKLSVIDITHPDDKDNIDLYYQQLEGKINSYSTEKRYIKKDGEIFWGSVTTSTIKDENGNNRYFIGMVTDITEQKQTELQVKQDEENYRLTIYNLLVGVVVHAKDTSIILSNPKAHDILGLSEEQMQGKKAIDPAWCFIHEDRTKMQLEDYPVNVVLSSGQILQNYVLGIERPDRSYVTWVNVNATPIFETSDEIEKVVVNFVDITENRQMEELLRESEKLSAIGQLAGGIAHDYNNQLAAIMGYSDMLVKKTEDPKLKNYAEKILRASYRSKDLTQKLLAFARKGKYQNTKVNIHQTIFQVVEILSRSLDKKIKLKQHLDASEYTVMGDPNQLQNAIMNLALNARDAMPDGGEIVFNTDAVSLDKHFCSLNPFDIIPGDYVKIAITDTGVGMDEEIQKKIFDPFYTTKEVGMGTGMGLSAVYGTMKTHNGAINIYSKPGVGSIVTLYLPTIKIAKEESIKTEKSKKRQGRFKILIVDDEKLIVDMAKEMLEDLKYKVVAKENGVKALEYYKQNWRNIDIVILDMVMPEMGGKKTFLEMKKVNPAVKCLLTSGYSINGEAQSIIDDGIMGFLQKPYNIEQLSNKLGNLLS